MFNRALFRASAFSSQVSIFRSCASKPVLPQPVQHRYFSITTFKMAQEFKLKDITTLSNLKNCDKQEAEVEGIEGGKVVIVKVQDQVHALNANCTHYGAPLAKGVVSPEGRIVCPWHGGQFQ